MVQLCQGVILMNNNEVTLCVVSSIMQCNTMHALV